MKKLFLILAILCLGAIMPMAIAGTQTQAVSVEVAEITQLSITPASLDFGPARPTVPKSGQEVNFDSTGSNVDVMISSSVEQGSVFEYIDFLVGDVVQNIKTFSVSLPISSPIKKAGTQITVPTGLVPGVRNGIITYTITSTFCGDNVKNGYEICDGTDLNGKDCTNIGQGFDGGTLACNAQCSGFSTASCTKTPACTPNCTSKCGGEADDCGGVCINPCSQNQTCTLGVCS